MEKLRANTRVYKSEFDAVSYDRVDGDMYYRGGELVKWISRKPITSGQYMIVTDVNNNAI